MMDRNENPDDETGTGLSNEALGLIIAGLVLAWFLIGLVYAVSYNYGGT
jgi:hypothetical protein